MPSRRHAIADDLRHQISTGRLKAGERLPSEAHLATHYMVSTATLRSALAVLEAEGYVEKIHGKGNFVRRPLHRITYVGGQRELVARAPVDPALRITVRTAKIRASGHLTALLKVPAKSPLTELFLLSHEKEEPHSLARIYIPRDLAPTSLLPKVRTLDEALRSLAAPHPPPAEIREKVGARLPTPDEASTLRISTASAVLTITRVTADRTGRVVAAALLVFPGDRVDAVFTTHHTIDERGAEG
ncbi:GntR family transcriptional regulator [Streptomyces sp. NPDC052610]|uniref:GntR family transcriptional regulator n=1 Tax=Streptomyces sp. NPDC052610 TaxID=3154952 RepID=UPI0034180F68